MWIFRRFRKNSISPEIYPDEILIDSSNISEFDTDQFEGRIEQPLSSKTLTSAGILAIIVIGALIARAGTLQLVRGAVYAKQAEENQLSQQVIFADRGMIVDRMGTPLAYNERQSVDEPFASRIYADMRGLAHVVGYVKQPAKDSSGFYYRTTFTGLDGAEKVYDQDLGGVNGSKLTETDAHGKVISESTTEAPQTGKKITLSIDANVTQGLYDALAEKAIASHFQGGAAVLMDVHTGELIALTSFPEYSQNALLSGDAAAFATYSTDKRQPFLDRATKGLYAPGSIVKPVVGAAALQEGVIDENKQILSTGSISLPNPYDPAHPSVFKDWRVNGWVDVRKAIAVSSDVYFYEVGGGFQGQPGLGIDKLDKYFRMFGFGSETGLEGFVEEAGNIPTIDWKKKAFPKDPTWRVGDTYHTAIGQYGMQITPLQAAREASALANGGILLTPTILASSTPKAVTLPISSHALQVVREGMRMGVVDGIAQAVKFDAVHVAAKTGTAQVGMHNEYINSWMIGFFPYEHPRYAYAVVLEKGPAGTTMGSPAVMAVFLQWLQNHAPEYTKDTQ